MFKTIATVCITAVVVDFAKTIQFNKFLNARKVAKPTSPPARKNDAEEMKLWHLSSASNKIARREFHGEYIGLPSDQKNVDLDFELIIARNR